jgi:transcriptional regulator with XRE-family HTH domain
MRLQSRNDQIADLRSKKFRDAFISSQVSNTLALQIRVLRQERGWTQAHLAKLLGTSQNAVYRLESPQYGKYSITTLKRLASIFDVGLAVWLVPFSKLVDRVTNLSTEDILVPSFNDDPGFQESVVTSASPESMKPSLRLTYGATGHYQPDDRPSKLPAPGEPFELNFPRRRPLVARADTQDANRLSPKPLREVS